MGPGQDRHLTDEEIARAVETLQGRPGILPPLIRLHLRRCKYCSGSVRELYLILLEVERYRKLG